MSAPKTAAFTAASLEMSGSGPSSRQAIAMAERVKPFTLPDQSFDDVADAPPPEVLEALVRAGRVMAELGRRNVSVSLETSAENGSVRVLLHHRGTASAEISPRALLDLLDGESVLLPGPRRPL